MSPVTKRLAALGVMFGLHALSLSLFSSGIFSWSNQYDSTLLKAASRTDAGVTLETPAKTDDGFVLKGYDEPTPRSGIVLTAKESSGISVRSFVVNPFFFRITFAPKVSRYVCKSVLNI